MNPISSKRAAIAAAALALLALAACRSSGAGAPRASSAPTSAPAVEPVLYARDGSVVPVGRDASGSAPIHGVQGREESRMQILDLYQRVVSEKEALALEVAKLDTTLSAVRAEEIAASKERDAMRARVETLEAELARASGERDDLAARLTTAQIRRLEAEKLLLEARLAAVRTAERTDASRKDRAKRPREASSASPDAVQDAGAAIRAGTEHRAGDGATGGDDPR